MRGNQSVPPEADKTPVKKRSPTHSRQHYTQARTGVSLLKSPVINITRVARRQQGTTLHSNEGESVVTAAVSLSDRDASSLQCSGGTTGGVGGEAVLRRSPRHKSKWRDGPQEHGRKETLKSVSA